MKKQYEKPQVEVLTIEEQDIITVSYFFDLEGLFDKKADTEWEW